MPELQLASFWRFEISPLKFLSIEKSLYSWKLNWQNIIVGGLSASWRVQGFVFWVFLCGFLAVFIYSFGLVWVLFLLLGFVLVVEFLFFKKWNALMTKIYRNLLGKMVWLELQLSWRKMPVLCNSPGEIMCDIISGGKNKMRKGKLLLWKVGLIRKEKRILYQIHSFSTKNMNFKNSARI